MTKLVLLLMTTLAICLIGSQVSYAQQSGGKTSHDTKNRVEYDLIFSPTDHLWFDQLVRKNSRLFALQSKPPLTNAGLKRRVASEKLMITDLLRSEGFYAGKVSTLQNRGSRSGQLVSVEIDTGPQFLNKSYQLEFDTALLPKEAAALSELATTTFKTGARAKAASVLETEQILLRQLTNIGFPFADVAKRDVTVDHQDHSLSTTLRLTLGPRSTYGDILFSGLKTADEAYLLQRLKLRKGSAYSQAELDEAKTRLLNTGLFTNVNIRKPNVSAAYGAVPLVIEVRERPRNQITLSAGASTTDGPKGSVEWRHRNLFGSAQNLVVKVQGDKNKAEASTTLEWPNFVRDDQILTTSLSAEYDDTNMIGNTTLKADVSLGRWYDDQRIFASIGADIEYIKQANSTDIWLASLPVRLDINRADSLLNPNEGFKFFADVRPFVNLEDQNQIFVKTETGGSTYNSILDEEKLTVATWIKAGAIFGENLVKVPTSKRFYLGGGGSVRAFARDSLSAPNTTGALAKLEGGVEVRTRFNAKFGAVAFVEGGKVFDTLDVDLRGDWHAGAGLGFRYFTSFGPVRVDLALPVSQKADFDDVQLHVGLGQAF